MTTVFLFPLSFVDALCGSLPDSIRVLVAAPISCHEQVHAARLKFPDLHPMSIICDSAYESIGVTSLGLEYLSFLKMKSKSVMSVHNTSINPRLSAVENEVIQFDG
jgi:hypothetical protein